MADVEQSKKLSVAVLDFLIKVMLTKKTSSCPMNPLMSLHATSNVEFMERNFVSYSQIREIN